MTSESENSTIKDENYFSEPADREVDVSESDFDEIEVKELALRFSRIALDEREAGLFDMHGVSPALGEDPETLSTSLKEINELLTYMRDWKQARAFRLAESNAPEYARNDKLLLMFLRCENFNAKAAATRLISFFEHKLTLFGPVILCKETVGQSDLSAEDLDCVTAGYVQLLPRRDHVGRAQLVYFPGFAHWATLDNAIRSVYYWCMVALRDEETQKKGLVLIVHRVGNDGLYPKDNSSFAWKTMHLMGRVLPMKIAGHHVCSSPSSGLRFYFSFVTRFFASTVIARTRFHEGTFEEIDQKLAGFGINGINLVISYEGGLKVDRHKEMIRSLQCLEAHISPADDYVILPSHTDVLLGRGKPIQNHPGNIRLGLIVESLLQKHGGFVKREEKTQLSIETVYRMKGAGVRFLTKCNEGWQIAPDRLARERVCSTFRTVRDRIKKEDMAPHGSRSADIDLHSNKRKKVKL